MTLAGVPYRLNVRPLRGAARQNTERACMMILGIESSCDETAAALVERGEIVHASVVASQTDLHAEYAGVVPGSPAAPSNACCPPSARPSRVLVWGWG